MLDVRGPIGWLFVLYGGMLVVYGLVKPVITSIESQGLAFNLNLVWGVVMGIFGLLMLALEWLERRPSK